MFNLDAIRETVSFNGSNVPFTRKEYAIVELLYLRGDVVSKDEMLSYLYESDKQPEMKILDVFLCKIRRKFRNVGALDAIETIWGRGFRFAL